MFPSQEMPVYPYRRSVCTLTGDAFVPSTRGTCVLSQEIPVYSHRRYLCTLHKRCLCTLAGDDCTPTGDACVPSHEMSVYPHRTCLCALMGDLCVPSQICVPSQEMPVYTHRRCLCTLTGDACVPSQEMPVYLHRRCLCALLGDLCVSSKIGVPSQEICVYPSQIHVYPRGRSVCTPLIGDPCVPFTDPRVSPHERSACTLHRSVCISQEIRVYPSRIRVSLPGDPCVPFTGPCVSPRRSVCTIHGSYVPP